MEQNGLAGGLFPGMGSSGMLGLELPLHQTPPPPPPPPPAPQQQQQQQNPQNPHHHLHHPQMVSFGQHESNNHHPESQSQQPVKNAYNSYASTARPKQQSPLTLSDDEEPGFTGDDSTSDSKRKNVSPWQRMKWTDSMVRLLIMAVFYIGDEVGSEVNDPTGKKKAAGGGMLQKKGKWKSVSRAMMEKGFYVSPQQCEDKFNDLNKRYKRVNDILGKGTACKVVENQALLDTMDLQPKMKEEVRKLLNSKHLFFREMCAYHNSCGHGSVGVPSGANHSTEVATDQSHVQHQPAGTQQQQRCSHSSENAQIATNSRSETEGSKPVRRAGNEEDEDEDYDDSDDDEDDNDDDEDDVAEGNSRGHNDDDDDRDDRPSRKRPRKDISSLTSTVVQQLNGELMSVVQDGAKTVWEKKQWMMLRLMKLEEQQVSYQYQAYELEKQRLKWVKFSGKKEREMEKAKLENERRRLENERMVLLVRQKELELVDLQNNHHLQLSSNKRSDPSSITG